LSLRTAIRRKRHSCLLKNALRGDEKSFRCLYTELFRYVDPYVSRRVHNEQDAEDLVGTVFHHFLANLTSYDHDRGSVLAWVMTITRNVVIDHHRRSRELLTLEEGSSAFASPSRDPLTQVIQAEQTEQIMAELASLPPKTEDIFNMRIAMDMSWREISSVMDLSESAVRKRFSRTVEDLRRRFKVKGHTDPKEADDV
jgi:RNA polymerase sigma-70 factor (ECF subfamily)